MKTKSTESRPSAVPFSAKQGGEVQVHFPFGEQLRRWSWTEPSVWTDRMLTALEQGVKEGKWFSLIQRWPNTYFAELGLFSLETAHAAACQSALR